MQIKIKTTNLEMTPDISDYFDKKMAAVEKLINPKDESAIALVELAKTTNHHKGGEGMYKAEINLHIAHKDFYVFSEGPDIFAAIDNVKDEITGKLRGAKDKRVSFFRRSGAKMKNMLKGFGGGK